MTRVLALMILALLMVYGCEEEKVQPAVKATIVSSEIPAQESWNASVLFTDSGRTKAVLTAGYMQMLTRTSETLLDSSIKVEFYNRARRVSTTLTARRGKVDDQTKFLYAYEDVIVTNDSGVVLRTEELMWNNDKERIATDKFVTIISPNEKIQGYGFESDQYLRNYTIYRITYTTTFSRLDE